MKNIGITVGIFIFSLVLSACVESSQTGQPDLEGATWILTALNTDSPIEGTQLTIHFESGQVSGNAGCNSYSGSYQVNGDTISISALSRTEIGCLDPEGIIEQENNYLEKLEAANRFELDDDVLRIFADSQQSLTFER